jgi:hypothetical protein
VACAVVDNLMDERHWKVIFGTCVIEIAKVCAYADSALFFINGYRVGNPRGIGDGVDEPSRT